MNFDTRDKIIARFNITPLDEIMALAIDSHTSSNELEVLFDYEDGRYRTMIASNPSLAHDLLEKLSTMDMRIKENIAKNETTPMEILTELLKYECYPTVYEAAKSAINMKNIKKVRKKRSTGIFKSLDEERVIDLNDPFEFI